MLSKTMFHVNSFHKHFEDFIYKNMQCDNSKLPNTDKAVKDTCDQEDTGDATGVTVFCGRA
jgi:hypothetical protein